MKKHSEKDWEESFKADMKRLEDVHFVRIPTQIELLQEIEKFKQQRKKAFIRELFLFFVTAFLIFAFYAVIALKHTTIFVWIQIIVLFGFPVLLLIEHLRRNNRSEVFRGGSK